MTDGMRSVRFDGDGLVPAVVQDALTGEVLMLAYMDREALERTAATGDAWYWSRSRRRLWRKGEESGHTQRVRAIRADCDGDAVLLSVAQTGPACHTGSRSCFHNLLVRPDESEHPTGSAGAADDAGAARGAGATGDVGAAGGPAAAEGGEEAGGGIVDEVYAVIRKRLRDLPEGSYTAALVRLGRRAIARKVAEESEELIRAAAEESDRRVVEEAADLLFHCLILLAARGVDPHDVRRELERRRRGR